MNQQQSINRTYQLGLAMGGILLFLVILTAFGMSRESVALAVPTSVAASTVGVTPTLSSLYSYMEPTKRAFFERLEHERSVALTALALNPQPPTVQALPSLPPRTAGIGPPHRGAGSGIIIESPQAPLPAASYVGRNEWLEELANWAIAVYAGGEKPQQRGGAVTQGVVVVLKEAPNGAFIDGGTYRTPTEAGAVRITDAVGERLTLQAADGTTFYFDVATRQWVNP